MPEHLTHSRNISQIQYFPPFPPALVCALPRTQIRGTKQFLKCVEPSLLGALQELPWISVDPGPVLAELYWFRTKIGLWLGTVAFHGYLLISRPKQTALAVKKQCWGIRQHQAWKGLWPQGQQGQVHLGNTLRTASLTLSLSTHDFKFNRIRKLCMQDTERRTCQPAGGFRTGQVKQATNDSLYSPAPFSCWWFPCCSCSCKDTHFCGPPELGSLKCGISPRLSSSDTSATCHNLALALNHWLELQPLPKQGGIPTLIPSLLCQSNALQLLLQLSAQPVPELDSKNAVLLQTLSFKFKISCNYLWTCSFPCSFHLFIPRITSKALESAASSQMATCRSWAKTPGFFFFLFSSIGLWMLNLTTFQVR